LSSAGNQSHDEREDSDERGETLTMHAELPLLRNSPLPYVTARVCGGRGLVDKGGDPLLDRSVCNRGPRPPMEGSLFVASLTLRMS